MERRQQMSSLATTSLSSNQPELQASPPKPITISTYTCTDPIEMQSVETLTEVRTNPFLNYDPISLGLNPLPNITCYLTGTTPINNNNLINNPPKKPPRITKACTDVTTLPPIPERYSPKQSTTPNISFCHQLSESSSDENSIAGHQNYLHNYQQYCSHHQQHHYQNHNNHHYQNHHHHQNHTHDQSYFQSNKTATHIYPYLIKDNLGIEETNIDETPLLTQTNFTSTAIVTTTIINDAEFINSEFYIDESLPSSLNSDPQDDASGCYSSSNSSRPPNACSCSTNDLQYVIGGEKSTCDDGGIQQPKNTDDDAATIILLLQVQCCSNL